ncbi:cell envelope integrity protein TolA [Nocardia sp. NPDC050435]|uniref:cell envelope integrity protein TolA n=1 Tax=Nocardia sp. NPDC050435 TaxID=3155040 RepID=UPI0033F371CB
MPPREDDGGTTGPSIPEMELPGNPWPDIGERAANDAGWLKFDPQAAVVLAGAIDDFQWNLFSLRNNAMSLTYLPALATPEISSGSALSEKFGQQGEEMYRILGAHHKILDDMYDAVVTAGKNMVKAEEGNVQDFENEISKIKMEIPDTHYANGTAPGALTDREGDHGNKKGYSRAGSYTRRERPTESDFNIEDNRSQPNIPNSGNLVTGIGETQGKSWNALHANRNYLDNGLVADYAADAAAAWKHIGDKIDEWSTTFGNKVAEVLDATPGDEDGKWQGKGSQAMHVALDNYKNALKPLATTAANHHSLMNYVAQFVVDTHYWAPPYAREEDDPTYYLIDRQHVFGQTYVRGVSYTASHIPKFANPTETFKDVPPIFDARDKNKNGKIDDDEKIKGDTNDDGKLDENEQKALAEQQAKQSPGPAPGGPGPAQAKPGPAPGLSAAQKKAQAEAAENAKKQEKFAEQQRKDAERRAKEQEAYEKQQRAENDRRQAEAEQRAKDASAKQDAAQRAAEERAKQQANAAAAKEAASSAQQAAQQGLQAAQQAVEQALSGGQKGLTEAMSAAQQAAQNALTGAQSGLNGLPKAGDLAAKLGGPGPGPSSLAKGLGLTEAAKLFPRAGAATVATAGTGLGALGRAGAASPMQATPGSPGPAGAAGQGAGQGNQNYKRPTYLESDQHLDELLGEAPKVVRPVVEQ